MKFKRGFIKLECIVKLDKLLHKLDKNLKFNKRKKTMEIFRAKSNMRLTILHNMGVITPDPNTMTSNATAS